jgi:hypothetical protein
LFCIRHFSYDKPFEKCLRRTVWEGRTDGWLYLPTISDVMVAFSRLFICFSLSSTNSCVVHFKIQNYKICSKVQNFTQTGWIKTFRLIIKIFVRKVRSELSTFGFLIISHPVQICLRPTASVVYPCTGNIWLPPPVVII